MKRNKIPFLTSSLIIDSLKQTFIKLDPREQIKNPVMFIAYLSALFITWVTLTHPYSLFTVQICIWLWFTVLFANFASAIAESKGKAQANDLRKNQIDIMARKWVLGKEVIIPQRELVKGDMVVCDTGNIIPADGEVIEGIALVDESAITGESAPVIRESGGDRSAVTGGTKIVNDKIMIKITSDPGNTFLDKMIQLIEQAQRQKTPNEIALTIVLAALSLIFLVTVVSLKFFSDYSQNQSVSLHTLVSLLVCLIPTTISALLSAIGIAGMNRLIQHNVVAKSGRAIEAAGDINLLLLDKTGTITLGNRMATEFIPVVGIEESKLAEAALLSSLSDETPEGRSIVVLAKDHFHIRAQTAVPEDAKTIPFSAKTRISGIEFVDKDGNLMRSIKKGAVDAIKTYVESKGKVFPDDLLEKLDQVARKGGTPLAVIENDEVLGGIYLKDIIKGGVKERFNHMRKMGIKTIMITGDNPLTAAAVAAEAGVDDFVAQATPEQKLQIIRDEQKKGRLVAMTGDGTNDAPALAQADVGVAMNTGTPASRDAGNMVDLDSNPTKLIDIVEIGKQLLITRGSLTTFSIANDVAKYFAIIPALFGMLYADKGDHGPLKILDLMNLGSPESAILSAVIFNALIIIALIPLALKGVNYKPTTASALLRRNLFIYGLGGIIAPFIGIKVIDLIINSIGII